MARADLTVTRLRDLLDYNPDTGVFTWRRRPNRNGERLAGSVAGTLHASGYRKIGLDGRVYWAHRLAWFYIHAQWPADTIDHRDGDRGNNAYANLRDVSHAVNLQNRHDSRCSRSGFLGVTAKRNRWRATLRVGGVTHRLGTFATPEQAHEAYLAAKRRLHPGHTLGDI